VASGNGRDFNASAAGCAAILGDLLKRRRFVIAEAFRIAQTKKSSFASPIQPAAARKNALNAYTKQLFPEEKK